LGLEKPNSGLDPGETFFPNSVSDLDSDETFQILRNVGLDIDEIVCLLDSQLLEIVIFRGTLAHSNLSSRCIWQTASQNMLTWAERRNLDWLMSQVEELFSSRLKVTSG
jgi:hypothetical protein